MTYQNESPKFRRRLYYELWTMKSGEENKITYDDIERFIHRKGGVLITKKQEWQKMKNAPSHRLVRVQCENHHKSWKVRVRDLFSSRWCPHCQTSFCQRVLEKYLEKILSHIAGYDIKTKSECFLFKCFNIRKDRGGLMKFDVFIKQATLSGRYKGQSKYKRVIISIAAEYDGIHHDKYPNPIHNDFAQFNTQKMRDQLKDSLTIKKNCIIIRIKSLYGFNAKTKNKFQREIIRQIQDWMGLKIDPIPKWIWDAKTDSLKKDPSNRMVDVPLSPDAPCKPKLSFDPKDGFKKI